MLRATVKHVRDRPPGRHCIDRNLLVARVLGEDANKRVNSSLGARVQRVLGHAEILGRVGRHEDDATTIVEVAVCLARDEKLAAGVQREDTIEFFLLRCLLISACSLVLFFFPRLNCRRH